MKNVINILSLIMVLVATLLAGCQKINLSEFDRFESSFKKELPFKIDSLLLFDGIDIATYQFVNKNYVTELPDTEIGMNGEISVYNTFGFQKYSRQTEDKIWRNVVVSKRNQRVICIDRYLTEGRTKGFIYVLQSESNKYPTIGKYHWDVSNLHNMEVTAGILDRLRDLTLRRLKANGSYIAPASQNDYWALIFHADSLMEGGLYAEAKQIYDLAFTEDRYILPSHLSGVAQKMAAIHDDEAAQTYLNHRVAMEPDFYEDPSTCHYLQLRDTFEMRQRKFSYDLVLKQCLEWVLERDQYDRMLWSLAVNKPSESQERIDKLARRAMDTDRDNLAIVNQILSETGFPRKSQVGDFATQAIWIVFQHSDLNNQKQFLPQLEEAVRQGDLAPAAVAMLKDRIDVREGRPQKYGTQWGEGGKLCPLLDASRVNEWREEVGLPPIEIK